MAEQNETGKTGEAVACSYLEINGYKVLKTNWHHGHYEIDIVATDGKDIVIVEVKTRSINYLVPPEQTIDNAKINRLAAAAEAYVRINRCDMPIRFDVILLVKDGDAYTVEEHIEDAFYPPVKYKRF